MQIYFLLDEEFSAVAELHAVAVPEFLIAFVF
jgi:hypothetical protein